MTPRDTRTGGVLEQMILPSLERGGDQYETGVNIGNRPGGRRHILDVLAKKENNPEQMGVNFIHWSHHFLT